MKRRSMLIMGLGVAIVGSERRAVSQTASVVHSETRNHDFDESGARMRHTLEVTVDSGEPNLAVVRVQGHVENSNCCTGVRGVVRGRVHFTDGTNLLFDCAMEETVPGIGLGDRPHTRRWSAAGPLRHATTGAPRVSNVVWDDYRVVRT